MTVTPNEAARRVDIAIGGKPFTSYIWPERVKKPVLDPIRSASGTPGHPRVAAQPASGRARRSSASRRPLVQLRERQRHRLLEQLRRDQAAGRAEDGHHRASAHRLGEIGRRSGRAGDGERLGAAGRQDLDARAHPVHLLAATAPPGRSSASPRSRRSTNAWSSPTRRTGCSACASRGRSSSRRPSRWCSTDIAGRKTEVPAMDNAGVTGEYHQQRREEGRRRLGDARPLDDARRDRSATRPSRSR